LHAHQLRSCGGAGGFRQSTSRRPASLRPQHPLCTRELRQKISPPQGGIHRAFGKRLEQRLLATGLSTNDGFQVSTISRRAALSGILREIRPRVAQKNGILVTHPGFDEDWRRSEFETLQKYAGDLNRFQR